jgi:hypothetical protein
MNGWTAYSAWLQCREKSRLLRSFLAAQTWKVIFPNSNFSGFYCFKVMSMAKYNIKALPFSGFDIEFQMSHRNLRPTVRRKMVNGRLKTKFTAAFVGSSGSASDTRGTVQKCDFKTDFFFYKISFLGSWWPLFDCGIGNTVFVGRSHRWFVSRMRDNVLSRSKQCGGGEKFGVKLLNNVSS